MILGPCNPKNHNNWVKNITSNIAGKLSIPEIAGAKMFIINCGNTTFVQAKDTLVMITAMTTFKISGTKAAKLS